MAEVLSQSEIDALLSAVTTGTVDTQGTASQKAPWIAYDLTSTENMMKHRFAGLQGIHERFARHFRSSLAGLLKRNVGVYPTDLEFVRFGDYSSHLIQPTSLGVLRAKNLGGHVIVAVSAKLAYALVDAYYGGAERPYSKPGGKSQFTAIENNMIGKVRLLAARDLEEAWRLNHPVDLEYVGTETNPQFLGVIHGSDVVAVGSFHVEFDNLAGPMVIMIQQRPLERIQQFLSFNITDELSPENGSWRDHWVREILGLQLGMRVELGATCLTLKQVRALTKGNVIPLSQNPAGPLTVVIEGVPKAKGLMGTYRGNSAVRITETPAPGDREES